MSNFKDITTFALGDIKKLELLKALIINSPRVFAKKLIKS